MAKKPGQVRKKRVAKSRPPKKTKKNIKASSSSIKDTSLSGLQPAESARRKWWKRERIEPRPVNLSNVWQLSRDSAMTIWNKKGLFLGVILVYGLLNLVFVQGFSSTNIPNLKHELNQVFSGHLASLSSAFSIFGVLINASANSSSPAAVVYQIFLALVGSLAIIWALRQALAGHAMRIRDPYYRGMYPLIPFIVILIIIAIQLLPLLIGTYLYALVINNGIAVAVIEKILWLIVLLGGAWWTLYMLSASLFALYIVTLPDSQPLQAIRTARKLVNGHRLLVMRKIVCLPIILFIVAEAIMIPTIVWLSFLAPLLLFILTMLVLLAIHGYMYTLYRELLND